MTKITKKVQAELDGVKDAFKTATGKSLALTDEALAFIREQAGTRWDSLMEDDEAFVAFLKEKEKQAASVSVADPGISALVAKLDGEFHHTIETNIEAIQTNKASAVTTLAELARCWTVEELDACPMPGTKADDVKGTNFKPDTVEKMVSGKKEKFTWSNDIVSAMPEGKDWESVLDDVSKARKTPGSVPRFKGMSETDLDGIQKSFEQKRNGLRNMFKKAVSLHHQMRAIEAMPKVGIAWEDAKLGSKAIFFPNEYGCGLDHDDLVKSGEFTKASSAPKPLFIWDDTKKPAKGLLFSVQQVLNMNVREALAKGGTMNDLVETMGKGGDDKPDGTGDGSDWDVDTVEVTTSQLVNALNVREKMALIRKKIANKKGEGNDLLDNICSLYLLIKPIYDQNKTAFDNLQKRPDAEAEGSEAEAA